MNAVSSAHRRFDVIVIGGGHAGCEAAAAAARLGCRTLLITQTSDDLGQMSCNPAIGGIGKGHLVKEIDALGGLMARAADAAGIQFRLLNRRKGPAVRATRAQADRQRYRVAVRRLLDAIPHLLIFQAPVADLRFAPRDDESHVAVTQTGLEFAARAVVLTAGTFLHGLIHIGTHHYPGGRMGQGGANRLADRLAELQLPVGRLKTGTPPRIDGRTIDYAKLIPQPGDEPRPVFSFLGHRDQHPPQVNCWLAYTGEATHDLIRANLHQSPMYSGIIEGIGPRYCPSIEDKVVRFADKSQHQVFIEPEGLDTHEIYPNGISTSLPFEVQEALVHSIPGLEQAHLTRPGYAIEYDFFDPRALTYALETRAIPGLFFAGQINGTTGYEEAAAQGLLAGTNAALRVQGREPWHPRRDEAYLGVLVDDLITRGADEPYRMFTSRAEHRLLLREDNADLRLTPVGRQLGLVDDDRWNAFARKRDAVEQERARLDGTWYHPNQLGDDLTGGVLAAPMSREARLSDLLRRPEMDYGKLMQLPGVGPGVDHAVVAEQVEIQCKYAGYIAHQNDEIRRSLAQDQLPLPADLDYGAVRGLSTEVRQRLERLRPLTLGQASRLTGITPAAISLLLIHLKRRAGGTAAPAATTDRVSLLNE